MFGRRVCLSHKPYPQAEIGRIASIAEKAGKDRQSESVSRQALMPVGALLFLAERVFIWCSFLGHDLPSATASRTILVGMASTRISARFPRSIALPTFRCECPHVLNFTTRVKWDTGG